MADAGQKKIFFFSLIFYDTTAAEKRIQGTATRMRMQVRSLTEDAAFF